MPELEAQGPEPEQRWRRTLGDQPVTLGRTNESDWQVTWDNQISRRHALLSWQGGLLHVKRLTGAKNQIFYRGGSAEDFTANTGEQFVIGQTTFTLVESTATGSAPIPVPHAEFTCSRRELQEVRFVDANERIEALAGLPGMIRFSPSDQQVEGKVVEVLLQGIPRADAAAVVWVDPAASASDLQVQVRAAAGRGDAPPQLQPSRRLVHEAIHRRRQAVLHTWLSAQGISSFTLGSNADWAMCAPLPDDPEPGWALYLIGHNDARTELRRGTDPTDVEKGDLKFASLVAEIFGALRQVRHLQRRQNLLSQVFSQPVLTALAEKDIDEVLRPRQTEVTVLFCDLRGSCRISESTDLSLAEVWERMSQALGIITGHIIDKEGVIGDFQGDAAMAFWGWPHDHGQEQVEKAARAALAIRKEFGRVARQPGHPLHGFACGIGIAHGPAIAGKLGTVDQLKIGVFGPVVNLAARLESMTKLLQVPILIDENAVAQLLATDSLGRWARCRRLARVRPYGMERTLLVSELLPAAVEPGAMREQDRGDYEAALDAFLAGQWPDARRLLDHLPGDGPGNFLHAFMARHADGPPPAWDGTIALESK